MLEEEAVRRSKPTVIAVRINMTGNTLNFISTCTPYEKRYRFGMPGSFSLSGGLINYPRSNIITNNPHFSDSLIKVKTLFIRFY